jgi:hypothetical protein
VTTIQPYPSAPISDGSDIYTFGQKVPNEIVRLFFSYLKPDEISTAAQVCREWRTLASDFNLLKEAFYHSLPNPPQLEFRQERGAAYYAHLYQQLASFPENVKCNRYVLQRDGYPKEASYVHLSEYGFCFVLPKGIDIYDPCSGLPTVTYLLKHDESDPVCSLALSDLYFAIGYSSGLVDIRDCQTGQTIAAFNLPGFYRLDFFGQDFLSVFDITVGICGIYNIKAKALIRLDLPSLVFFQKLESRLLLGVDEEGLYYFIHRESQTIDIGESDLKQFPVAAITDEETREKRLFIVISEDGDLFLDTILIDQEYNFDKGLFIGQISPFHAILFKHGYLWNIQKDGKISKIDPQTGEESTVLSWSIQHNKEIETFAFWFDKKLYIYREGMCVLDFGVTNQEIVSNIASAFQYISSPFRQEDLCEDFVDLQPEKRVQCLAEEVQKGILFCYSLLYEDAPKEDEILRSVPPEEISEALKYYIKNYAQASTPEGRKQMLEEYKEAATERENKRRRIEI